MTHLTPHISADFGFTAATIVLGRFIHGNSYREYQQMVR